MPALTFDVFGHGTREVEIRYAVNGGYAGRDTAAVQAHVDELAELGIPAPQSVPTAYPLSNTLVSQAPSVQVPHGQTSGEAEWCLVFDGDDVLVAAACDHTDRALEVHGVAWSKQSAPDFVARQAWLLSDVESQFGSFTLKGWVRHDDREVLIQDGLAGDLLQPGYWLKRLREAGWAQDGLLFMSGTIPMIAGVDQFGEGWRVELADEQGQVSSVAYAMEQLPAAWE